MRLNAHFFRLPRGRSRGLKLAVLAVGSMIISLTLMQSAATAQQPAPTRSAAALQADKLFWHTFQGGDYDHLQRSLEVSTGAHLRDPSDAVTTAHLGFLHIWRISERARLSSMPPTITDDAELARSYFQRALARSPGDARYQGFLASAMLAEAGIERDPALRAEAMATMQRAIKAWPAFNLFTAGYVTSNLDASSAGYRQALAWQWDNLDVCAREKIDRRHPDIARLSARVESMPKQARDRRACNNTAIAPHNEEGFFLNLGDMLVKSGDWQGAQRIYAAAKRSSGYADWPYRDVLEQRIRDAPANVKHFNATTPPGSKPTVPMMLGSDFSCMACHRR